MTVYNPVSVLMSYMYYDKLCHLQITMQCGVVSVINMCFLNASSLVKVSYTCLHVVSRVCSQHAQLLREVRRMCASFRVKARVL